MKLKILENLNFIKYGDGFRDRSKILSYIGPSLWKVKKNILYYISYYNKNEFLIIDKWMETDFASSPCFTQCIISKEKFLISLVHDKGYTGKAIIYVKDKKKLSLKFQELQKYGKWKSKNIFIPSRKFWDLLFYYGMLEENIEFYGQRERVKPYLGYIAVRLAGGLKYGK